MPNPIMMRKVLGAKNKYGLTWLFRDEYSTPESAPIVTPRIAEAGTSIITDTGNVLPITANGLEFGATTANVSPRVLTQLSYARVAGLAIASSIRPGGGSLGLGFLGVNTSSPRYDSTATGFYDPTLLILGPHVAGWSAIKAATAGATYKSVVILRATGSFHTIDGQLVWVNNQYNNTPLYAGTGINNVVPGAQCDYLRLARLGSPWTEPYGPGALAISGTLVAGQTFIHEAESLLYFTLTNNGTAGDTLFRFRKLDSSNYWLLSISNDGSAILYEVIAGVQTSRGTAAAGVFANGERVGIQLIGTTIRIHDNAGSAIYYASALNFQTATDGDLQALATGAQVDNLEIYPVNLRDDALGWVNEIINPSAAAA